ncbi:glycoside hydrolase family 20 protein [Tellurirhabdus bombi]|uniref:glycoside hydrolase family 20 protein n=1 Tax=Tellurirhabdus bombi TaxID=2907205 RepID=UPI001F33D704|nr:family 20 glycosylhydrolase [Tellurirhabdus bombi]
MLKASFLWLGLLMSSVGFSQSANEYPIIPKPAKLEARQGKFQLSNTTTVMVPVGNDEVKSIADLFTNQLNASSGLKVAVRNSNKMALPGNLISFQPSQDASIGEEGYRIDIKPEVVTIEALNPKGFFYAVQSLMQLLPSEVFRGSVNTQMVIDWAIPSCRIEDKPRYSYRGLHLDVSRHFMPVAFVKKYIDLIALHKMNTFHWHLTDDQGWRIEIKKYPKLTQQGAERKETIIGHYYESDPQRFDGQPYDGFYTQNEVREVVKYAQSKYVTIIPEIEMPGHALAALRAYPEYGCTGGPYETATKWGIFPEVFCPYDKTFEFLQNILTEVMELFPSQYIHIGGDECPKDSWKQSKFCQDLIKKLGLKDEHELQSYFITRIDKWVTSKGRKIIGWDEILEGGLSPNATVMSWRGTEGGIAAAKQGHDAIMTPGNFLYLDKYQSDPTQEPTSIGGFLPLEQTYSYEPTPQNLSADAQKRIIGAQANVWTEYIKTPEHVEYMVWPRAAALSEVVWTPREQKDWKDFSKRIQPHLERLGFLNVSYSRAFYDVLAETTPTKDGGLRVTLKAKDDDCQIRYSLNGSEPMLQSAAYNKPLVLTQSGTVKAVAVKGGQVMGEVQSWNYIVSKATGKSVQLATAATRPKNADLAVLTDGKPGSAIGYLDDIRGIAGVKNADFNATIDLGAAQPITMVTIGLVKATAGNVLLPKQIDVQVSDDGKAFKSVKVVTLDPTERGKKEVLKQIITFGQTNARYVRVIAQNVGKVPAGMPNAGKDAWVAADEITVD